MIWDYTDQSSFAIRSVMESSSNPLLYGLLESMARSNVVSKSPLSRKYVPRDDISCPRSVGHDQGNSTLSKIDGSELNASVAIVFATNPTFRTTIDPGIPG